jgi:two-component system, cell cycle sensor histidine kinase and response regulator CckA
MLAGLSGHFREVSPMGRKSWRAAARFALTYAAVSAVWIIASDRAVAALFHDPVLNLAMQTYKGWGFVAVTAALLFLLMRRQLQRADRENLLLQTIISAVPEGIFLKDREGRFLLVNQRLCELVGVRSPADLIGRTDRDIYSPAEAEAFRAEEEALLAQGRPVMNREGLRGAAGSERRMLISKAPVTNGAGRVTGLVGIALEITERKHAEEELARERMYLRTLMDSIPDFIYFKDRQGRFLLNNRAHARLVGLESPADMAGKTDFDFFDRAVAQEATDIEQEIIRTGTPRLNIDEHEEWKEGREIWITSSKMPLRDAAGEVIGTFGISRDVTDQKEVELALRQSEEHYRAFFLNAPFGIYQTTLDGKELDLNPAHASIFGFDSPRDMIDSVNAAGGASTLFVDPAQRLRIVAAVRAAGDWKLFQGVRYRRRDGSFLTADVTMRCVKQEGDGEWFVEGFLEDVTEREQAAEERRLIEEQLQQAQKMEAVGRLAGGIAHDFNNLLTVIGGYGELALQQAGPGAPVRAALGEIAAAARRAGSLTAQLLAFSRRQILQPKRIGLDDLVSGMGDMLQRLLGEDIDLRILNTGGLWEVLADPGKLEQVVMNLAVNARDAMPSGGRLTIETSNAVLDDEYARTHLDTRPGAYVRLSVSDTGHGMDEPTLDRIFEPFFTTKEKGKGTGLGLATVYGIVTQSGGNIACTSRVGLGTTFLIHLPRAQDGEQGAASAGGQAERVTGGTETILLVEDDEMVRRYTALVLEGAGYTVLTAGDGQGALSLLSREAARVRMLVTDVVMPAMDGRTVALKAQGLVPGLPVLYLTGYTEDAIVKHGVLEDGVELLQKPFAGSALLSKVRSILDRRADGREVRP